MYDYSDRDAVEGRDTRDQRVYVGVDYVRPSLDTR